ncbi:Predicted Zn-dependent protease, minimal metalloprotease (MMP)-like domain [Lutimaribacter pacificus]|uniref:Predicted Zn-dependent protease, minimal metalloprotease (MMP)-like domain n=1 Tax=Lutimaribacter pacificus TaxID=391948 RepID=A0A1H0C304_9RHOB|nr:metallopeptidase family protein [Lutimaribacter pacificus]SDN52236.1 Predicted Zn-dependent protease, minimal metalloprotease (MMP)-like domain [Lutimaribacter pacificus]SHJ49354.1 Predicted Zn-dependent protease, minimal metalloprotease (MMP)-like domain [Lutimaribacter pacificus]
MDRVLDLDGFEQVARDTVAGFPAPFAALAGDVALRVADWPPGDILQELEIAAPLELTGLYDGIPLTEKSVWDQPLGPDVVWLFRQPILAEWRDRGDVTLTRLIAHVTVHEFAHHFGWSDGDIASIDRWWE